MRIIREIEARRIARAPTDVDPERADLPIARNRPHQEEDRDQSREEEQESELPAPATVLFMGARRCRYRHGFRHRADWRQGEHGFGCDADRRDGNDGFWGHCRRRRHGVLNGRLRPYIHGFDRRTGLDRGCATRQLLQPCPRGTDWRRYRRGCGGGILNRRRRQAGKPIVQLGLIGRILWLGSTPRWKAHLGPTLTPPDYDAYFARGRSAMPL